MTLRLKLKCHRDILDFEFSLFKALNDDFLEKENESLQGVSSELHDLFYNTKYDSHLFYLGEIEGKNCFVNLGSELKNQDIYEVEGNIPEFIKKGDVLSMDDYALRDMHSSYNEKGSETEDYIILESEVLDREYLTKKNEERNGWYLRDKYIKKYSEPIILGKKEIDDILKTQSEDINEEKREQEEREKREQEERERREKEEEKREKEYQETGKINTNNLEVQGNIIDNPSRKETLVLEKKVNERFSLYDLNHKSIDSLKSSLVRNEDNFTYLEEGKKVFNIKFEGEDPKKIFVNGIRVRRDKIEKVLNAIDEDFNEETIKIVSKLTQMETDLIQLKEISVKSLDIPIKVIPLNDRKYKLKLFKKEHVFEWFDIKDIFFNGRYCSSHFDLKEILRLCWEYYGMDKQQVFDKLKIIAILKEVKKD